MPSTIRTIVALLAVISCVSPLAMAQTDLERFERNLDRIRRETQFSVNEDVPIDQRTLIDFGGYVTFNFFAVDDFDQNTHILRQTTGNIYGRMNIDGVHQVFARVRSTYNDFNSGDDFDGAGDDWVEPTLERGIYRFDLARALAAYDNRDIPWNLTFEGGRNLVQWANGLVLSTELDGAVIEFSMDQVSLEVVAGRTRDSIIDIDSSRPDFKGDTHRNFFGGKLNFGPFHQAPRVCLRFIADG